MKKTIDLIDLHRAGIIRVKEVLEVTPHMVVILYTGGGKAFGYLLEQFEPEYFYEDIQYEDRGPYIHVRDRRYYIRSIHEVKETLNHDHN